MAKIPNLRKFKQRVATYDSKNFVKPLKLNGVSTQFLLVSRAPSKTKKKPRETRKDQRINRNKEFNTNQGLARRYRKNKDCDLHKKLKFTTYTMRKPRTQYMAGIPGRIRQAYRISLPPNRNGEYFYVSPSIVST